MRPYGWVLDTKIFIFHLEFTSAKEKKKSESLSWFYYWISCCYNLNNDKTTCFFSFHFNYFFFRFQKIKEWKNCKSRYENVSRKKIRYFIPAFSLFSFLFLGKVVRFSVYTHECGLNKNLHEFDILLVIFLLKTSRSGLKLLKNLSTIASIPSDYFNKNKKLGDDGHLQPAVWTVGPGTPGPNPEPIVHTAVYSNKKASFHWKTVDLTSVILISGSVRSLKF